MLLTWHSRDNLLWIEDHTDYYRHPIPAVLTVITSSASGRSKIKDVINFQLIKNVELKRYVFKTELSNFHCLSFWLVSLKDSYT